MILRWAIYDSRLGRGIKRCATKHPLYSPGTRRSGLPEGARLRASFDEIREGSVMPHKFAHGAWVFVGDGQKALFLINQREEKFPNLRHLAVEEHKDPPSREQGSDAPGRAYSSVGEIRSAVGETDWHELEKERFAASIADRINRVALSGAFNQLVIVAPPKILGDLRRKFTKETEPKIIAKVLKDLTHHTIPET